jgi:hypothetical protein
MNPLIDNLINGNLSEAKKLARSHSTQSIIHNAMGYGYNYNEGLLIACFLKEHISFQEYCDNMNNTK